MDVLDQISQSCAVFHSRDLFAFNRILVHSSLLLLSIFLRKRFQVISAVKLAMVNILLLLDYGGDALLLLEDTLINVV